MAVGGGSVGGASFELSADASAVTEALEKIRAELKQTEEAVEGFGEGFEKSASGLIVPSNVKDQLDGIASGFEDVEDAAKKLAKVDAFKAHQEEARAAATATKELSAETGKFAVANQQATESVTKLQAKRKEFTSEHGTLVPVLSTDTGKLEADLVGTAKRLKQIGSEAKLLQEQLGVTAAAPGLAKLRLEAEKLHATLGTTFKGFPEEANKAARSMSLVERFTGAADKVLGGLGLSVRGVSVLLGAGLATGLAGIIRIIQKLGGQLVEFVSAEHELARQTSFTFGSAADSVESFAASTASSLGASRREFLETANTFGALARQLDLPENLFGPFATQLTELTALIETRGVPGLKNIGDVAKAIEASITGDNKALKQLGTSTAEFAAIALKEFGKLPDQLTPTERSIVAIDALTKDAASAAKDLADGQAGFWSELGNVIGGTVSLVTDGVKELRLEHLEAAAAAAKQSVTAERLSHVSTQELFILKELAKGHRDTVGVIQTEIDRRNEHAKAVTRATEELKKQVEALHLNETAFLANQAAIDQVRDAFKTLARAAEDGTRRVQEANERLGRVRVDNAQKLNELTIRNERAAVDAAIRVNEAEKALEDARFNRQKRLEDAQDKADDARRQSFRSIRTAQERLSDFQRESARRIRDLKEKVSETHKQEAKEFTEAMVSIETAQRRGDAEGENAARRELARLQESEGAKNDLAVAERALAEQQKDDAIELKRLQRDLVEARADGAREITRAVRDQHRAEYEGLREIEKAQTQVTAAVLAQKRAHEDALRTLGELEVQMNRALFDAKKGIRDAERERDRAIKDATKGIERLARSIGITIDRLRELISMLNFQQTAGLFFAATQPFGLMAGGPAQAGSPYIVGERGPELFIPNSAGTVVSNDDVLALLKQLAASNNGGGSQQIIVNEVANDPEATAFMVAARLARNVNN